MLVSNRNFLFKGSIFRGELFVSGRVSLFTENHHLPTPKPPVHPCTWKSKSIYPPQKKKSSKNVQNTSVVCKILSSHNKQYAFSVIWEIQGTTPRKVRKVVGACFPVPTMLDDQRKFLKRWGHGNLPPSQCRRRPPLPGNQALLRKY